jgi:hypothetical protein
MDSNSAIVDIENYVLGDQPDPPDNLEECPQPEKDLDDLLTSVGIR